ncbi:undecaprenyldiphospho-muramoylpentapeptide beta-N-acetylglucosaminyltransferase [Sulfidibacter corallicola]|uniref:UDP-N-acetylglucosamine--N-acetylmuramyl-(pentapeptide) pyrophosphoryl-undecaprenol N-acetylglucosamine transferase n=1 Tax=Sulfidibacter corallicola TaxID=2818388 RepID=A0A8A4TFS5_SULCO|nr:undecaprenyldiphospho-muramoylpentapeptide beta-N-acetylglucosaminyltransferase [Sulfidibacter corallicola]QTD48042.1 undecaprenyldiphospho-muramoylpentapeptide beta-N-acetylglucosaminyltransferase [Sulfidibacter corallicola]
MSGCYMIAGGGTGGHIFPAIAIGEALLAANAATRVLFVGTAYGMEKDLIPKQGHTLLTLPVRGLLGKSLAHKAALLWRVPASLLLSLFYLLRFRPKVVIGVGGYASAPLLWTAALLRIPTMIQEQNAFPGLANRISSRVAKLACLGFGEAGTRLRCPSIVTGNPVRKDFKQGGTWSADRPILLVLGGSQGAAALNRILPELLAGVLTPDMNLRVVHQCGKAHEASVRAAYEGAAFQVEVVSFIEDLSKLMDDVRLVVCRSGASTIAELKLVGVPAVLVPFPRATHDHQTFNAKSLAACGAARLIPETELPQAGPILAELLASSESLANMAAAYPSPGPDSARVCAQLVHDLQHKRPLNDILKEHAAHVS